MSDENFKGYHQQPGKLPFKKPGSGGSNKFSKLRELDLIPESQGGRLPQPRGANRHDELLTSSSIGRRTPLVDGRWKVTGQAQYGDDVRLQGELIGRILRSPHHYAKIRGIDTSAAEALPGVAHVLCGQGHTTSFGVLPVTKDEHALAVEKVRHVGDLVAAVAAVDEATALEALRLIEVDYEVLESVHDMSKAIDDSENPIHDRGKYHIGESNVQKRVFQEFGKIDEMHNSIAQSSAKWTFAGVNHGFTEPHAVVAHWDPSGRLTLYTPQQVPHYVHRSLADVLEIPMHQINVFRTFVGGGFGGKSDPFPHEMCAAILARETGKPVRITFDREEVFWTNRGRHPSKLEMILH